MSWDDAVTGEYPSVWDADAKTPADPDTPVEMRFVLRLRDNPDDLGMRMVYADWLEERGHTAKAEVVRLLAEPPAEGTPAMARLREAVVGLPADWVATVARAPIEKCDVLTFKCPLAWEALPGTDDAEVRHCGSCNRNVYFCATLDQVRERGRQKQCVAFSPRLVRASALEDYANPDQEMWMGEVAEPPLPADAFGFDEITPSVAVAYNDGDDEGTAWAGSTDD